VVGSPFAAQLGRLGSGGVPSAGPETAAAIRAAFAALAAAVR
jgi:hypothetical protein